jgi:uncharacterized protein
MFRIGLRELERAGTLRVQHEIPGDDPLWEGSGLELLTGVDVDLEVTRAASGQIVARGSLRTRIGGSCRRCLAPVQLPVELPLDLVWSFVERVSDDAEIGDEIRPVPPGEMYLDAGEAVREELLLSVPIYLLCRDGCKGICPRCGVNRNETTCGCAGRDADPRWDALRAIRNESSEA